MWILSVITVFENAMPNHLRHHAGMLPSAPLEQDAVAAAQLQL